MSNKLVNNIRSFRSKYPVAIEIRHMIDVYVCSNCKHIREAENDLPKSGSYGKNVIAYSNSEQ